MRSVSATIPLVIVRRSSVPSRYTYPYRCRASTITSMATRTWPWRFCRALFSEWSSSRKARSLRRRGSHVWRSVSVVRVPSACVAEPFDCPASSRPGCTWSGIVTDRAAGRRRDLGGVEGLGVVGPRKVRRICLFHVLDRPDVSRAGGERVTCQQSDVHQPRGVPELGPWSWTARGSVGVLLGGGAALGRGAPKEVPRLRAS